MGIACLPVKGENFFNELGKIKGGKNHDKQKLKRIREVRK